jgi:hypothetical protein
MIRTGPVLTLAFLLLGGCASVDTDGYPSLEQRTAEVRTAHSPPITAAPSAVPVTDADRAAVGALAAQAQGGESAFRAALPNAERRAQAAPTLAALAELDRRALEAELAGQTSLIALLTPEQRRAADWAAAQTAALNRISALLGN